MITINDNDFQRLVLFVRDRYGINLEHKRQLVDARLAFDISRKGYNSFTTYLDKIFLEPDSDECKHMLNKLSTNYTFFFREKYFVSQLCNVVLPDLIGRGKKTINVWSAACSSGQEVYSVAMVLEYQKKLMDQAFDYEIVGTDINTETLREASLGIYSSEEREHIPSRYRQYALPYSENKIIVSDEIKKKVFWRYENLLSSGIKYEKYDIIFCRNVMIYFTPEMRRKVTVMLHTLLKPGGYLFTGSTESIDLERKYFQYKSPAFYKKEMTYQYGRTE